MRLDAVSVSLVYVTKTIGNIAGCGKCAYPVKKHGFVLTDCVATELLVVFLDSYITRTLRLLPFRSQVHEQESYSDLLINFQRTSSSVVFLPKGESFNSRCVWYSLPQHANWTHGYNVWKGWDAEV